MSLIERLNEKDKLRLIAEAGIKQAVVVLKKEPSKTFDAFSDDWSNSAEVFRGVRVGDGEFDIGTTSYGLVDEGRKINVNKANLAVLERLIQIILGFDETKAQELAASLIDWRDSDSGLSIPFGSAEDDYYTGLVYPYEAKDAAFEIPDELLLVKGMSAQILTKLRDYMTIYGSGKVNVNTASKPVLLALGLEESMVDKIISFRNGEDKLPGTADDNIFDNPAGIVSKLSQFYQFSDSEVAQLNAVCEQAFSTTSQYFMIQCKSSLKGGKRVHEVIAVADHQGKIFYWGES